MEHHTKNTIQATYWCAKCSRPTLHHVADGRRGGCIACIEKQRPDPNKPQHPKPEQQEMF